MLTPREKKIISLKAQLRRHRRKLRLVQMYGVGVLKPSGLKPITGRKTRGGYGPLQPPPRGNRAQVPAPRETREAEPRTRRGDTYRVVVPPARIPTQRTAYTRHVAVPIQTANALLEAYNAAEVDIAAQGRRPEPEPQAVLPPVTMEPDFDFGWDEEVPMPLGR